MLDSSKSSKTVNQENFLFWNETNCNEWNWSRASSPLPREKSSWNSWERKSTRAKSLGNSKSSTFLCINPQIFSSELIICNVCSDVVLTTWLFDRSFNPQARMWPLGILTFDSRKSLIFLYWTTHHSQFDELMVFFLTLNLPTNHLLQLCSMTFQLP